MASKRNVRARVVLSLASASLLLAAAQHAPAALLSESSSFGPGTITHDTVSGLRWLDLSLTTGRSYAAIVAALAGGDLAGYRLARDEEVVELWQHAAIDTGEIGDFVPQNHAPVVALAGLLGGPLSSNGNCGDGCSFFFTQGWIWSGHPIPASLTTASLAWWDNSAPLNPGYPHAPIGRAAFGNTTDTAAATIGAWLVEVPEPAAGALAPAAALALGALAGRRPPRLRTRASA
jgi:hypothetical protein